MKKTAYLLLLTLCISCSKKTDLQIVTQTNGPWGTNSYLIYDACSGDGALIDPGVQTDSLQSHIEEKEIHIRYILITHCHQDHVAGVPDLLNRYPDAQLCYSETEHENFPDYTHWKSLYPPGSVRAWEANPAIESLMNLDYSRIGAPDIAVNEKSELNLGNLRMHVYPVPGHSSGSVCYAAGGFIFTRDPLYFHTVGHLDY